MSSTYLYGANIHSNGVRQHYLRYGGAGMPLVLIPGITSPAATWGFVGDQLGRCFDVYVIDVRGRGLSESSESLQYDLDTYAEDVAKLIEGLGLDKAMLLGHSMGARIAIRAAHKFSDRVAAMVAIDPPVSGPGRRPFGTPLSQYLELIRLARRGVSLEAFRSLSPTWTDDQLRLRAEWLHTCDERAIIETYEGFQNEDIHQDLANITVPAQLIVAGSAGVVTREDVVEIQSLLPAIQVATVAGAGHMIPWDDEDGFFAALMPFLKSVVD